MDYNQAQYLIGVRKKIVLDGEVMNQIIINQCPSMRLRYELISTEDNEFTFLMQIHQSPKNTVRISLHCQDGDSKIGLVRVDYNAGHINPEIAIDGLPDLFLPYVGKHFNDNEHHVHFHVDGYKSLAWAIPIGDTDISAREMQATSIVNDLECAIHEFAKLINIETQILINKTLL